MTHTFRAATPPLAPAPPVGYYGQPIVKAHPWRDYVGWYFFTGGLAGASSVLAAMGELAGNEQLAHHARRAAMIGLLPSPALLVADLGKPSRFANMLRVAKPTSPMSVGSWLLSGYSVLAGTATLCAELHVFPRSRAALTVAAGLAGSGVATYTGVLVSDTATPAWHEAWRELPALFASSALASAGAVTTTLSALSSDRRPGRTRRPASSAAVVGAVGEVLIARTMQHNLMSLNTYDTDPRARRLARASRALSTAGALGLIVARRSRVAGVAAAASIAAGSACLRLAVLRAGTASANDPRSVLDIA